MINDYKSWFEKKQEFLHHLYHHDSLVMHRIINVIITLDYISNLGEEELNEDYDVIFEEGYKYLYSTVGELEIYINKYFDNVLHKYLDYEVLINYALYLNELKSAMLEQEDFNEEIGKEMSDIQDRIDDILVNKKDFTEELIDEFDNNLGCYFSSTKTYLTMPEVFDRIAEELQIV